MRAQRGRHFVHVDHANTWRNGNARRPGNELAGVEVCIDPVQSNGAMVAPIIDQGLKRVGPCVWRRPGAFVAGVQVVETQARIPKQGLIKALPEGGTDAEFRLPDVAVDGAKSRCSDTGLVHRQAMTHGQVLDHGGLPGLVRVGPDATLAGDKGLGGIVCGHAHDIEAMAGHQGVEQAIASVKAAKQHGANTRPGVGCGQAWRRG